MTLEKLKASLIFVFGSNLAGRHGAGAARYAREQLGAVYGVGYGLTGKCFAIPTKDAGLSEAGLKTLRNEEIYPFIVGFLAFAAGRPDLQFQLTRIGCGLAGKKDYEMADLVRKAVTKLFGSYPHSSETYPANIWLPTEWMDMLPCHPKRFEYDESTKTLTFFEKKETVWTSVT